MDPNKIRGMRGAARKGVGCRVQKAGKFPNLRILNCVAEEKQTYRRDDESQKIQRQNVSERMKEYF
jgi:hypothetical protein